MTTATHRAAKADRPAAAAPPGPHVSQPKKPNGTQSIHRALDAVRLLANNAASGMKLIDIADGVGLHHSTTHRILRALEDEGVVERVKNSRRYTIGSEMVWLGLGASSRFPIASAAGPALDKLSAQIGDAVFLTVRSGNDSVCADRRIGSYPIQVLSIAIGSRRPLGVSQGGRVILAFLPDRIANQVMDANAVRFDQYGISVGGLAENLKAARTDGYICSDGVTVKDTRVIAVPVLDVTGMPIAAISAIAVRRRLPASRIAAVAGALTTAAKEVSDVLAQAARGRGKR